MKTLNKNKYRTRRLLPPSLKLRGTGRSLRSLAMTALLFFLIFCYSDTLMLCYADIPHLINYQGKLTDNDGKPVPDIAHEVTFKIYNAKSGGTWRWQETQTVVPQKGIFNVLLGSFTALNLDFNEDYWLEISVKRGNEPEEVLGPRQQIASVGYAFRAKEVESIPRGIITIWSGILASIPTGWALCDGSNGTPDLRSKFIKGSDPGANPGATGGSLTHKHSASIATGGPSDFFSRISTGGPPQYRAASESHTHLMTGETDSANHELPHYTLAFIMKL